jgi:type VI secretion system secreted protein VgrG
MPNDAMFAADPLNGATFHLSAGTLQAGELRVASFQGVERMSRPFSLEIVVTTAEIDPAALEAAILGQPAHLLLEVPDGDPRAFVGVVWSVEAQGTVTKQRSRFRLEIAPKLRLLEHRKTSRIFQDVTVVDVLTKVLDGARIPFKLRLTGRYPARSYCVQYQETDLEFLTRLCAEEGIFYCFDVAPAPTGKLADAVEVVVFGDDARLYPRIAGKPELVYRASEGSDGLAAQEPHVQRFSLRRTVRPTGILIRDYDFQRPLLEIARSAETTQLGATAEPSTDPAVLAARGLVYKHQSEYSETQIDRDTAAIELEQHRRRAQMGDGASLCRRLVPGYRFNLEDHPIDDLNQTYVVTSVRHEGYAPEAVSGQKRLYQNRFHAIPASVRFRPRRPESRVQQAAETALVVGPEGQEIYTDEYGRIKVQFHWDLEGKKNERSSCWIRVAQAWAGPTFGFQFIPRIGMEVLVTFLGGDVDRPVVTGCLYNAVNAPTQLLPSKGTRSGIRTRTTPGGGGYNELTFDDRAGEEQVLLRAQKRLDEVILGDHSISVGGEQRSALTGNHTEEVGGNLDVKIGGQRGEEVRGGHNEKIGGDFVRAVQGEQRTSVGGDASTTVSGNQTLVVSGNHHVVVGHGEGEGHALLYVNGDYTVGVSQDLKLSGKKAIKLSVGDSAIELTEEGIKLTGKSISIEGADGASLKVKGHTLAMKDKLTLVSDTIELFSSKGSLVMEDEVHLDGKLVNLNCKPKAPDPKKEQAKLPEEGIVTFRVKQRTDGQPMNGVTMIIGTPSGEVIEREADAEGKVEIKGKKGERFMLIGVRYGDHVFGHQGS